MNSGSGVGMNGAGIDKLNKEFQSNPLKKGFFVIVALTLSPEIDASRVRL